MSPELVEQPQRVEPPDPCVRSAPAVASRLTVPAEVDRRDCARLIDRSKQASGERIEQAHPVPLTNATRSPAGLNSAIETGAPTGTPKLLTARELPDRRCPVETSRREEATVAGKRDARHRTAVAEDVKRGSVVGAPEAGGAVAAGRHEQLSVAGELDVGDPTWMAKLVEQPQRLESNTLIQPVCRGDRNAPASGLSAASVTAPPRALKTARTLEPINASRS